MVPSPTDFSLMALCGVIAAIGTSLLTHAYRMAEANLIAVFEYTGMIWAPLWGFLFFAEAPGPRVIVGSGMIIGAGLLVALRSPASLRIGNSCCAPGMKVRDIPLRRKRR